MAVYMISYDLHNPQKNYETLVQGIIDLGNTHRLLNSQYLVGTDKYDAASLRDYVKQFIDEDDELFINRLSVEWAATLKNSNDLPTWLQMNTY